MQTQSSFPEELYGKNDPQTFGQALAELLGHPWEMLVARWNWKAALLSSIFRAWIFFAANLDAGLAAAISALTTEFAYRAAISGFYGAVIQSFRRVQPAWQSALVMSLMVPAVSHSIEFAVHQLRGTERLARSILASVAFTGLSTLFNLFAMRRGALVVDEGGESLTRDLRRMPRILTEFILVGPNYGRNLLAQGANRLKRRFGA